MELYIAKRHTNYGEIHVGVFNDLKLAKAGCAKFAAKSKAELEDWVEKKWQMDSP